MNVKEAAGRRFCSVSDMEISSVTRGSVALFDSSSVRSVWKTHRFHLQNVCRDGHVESTRRSGTAIFCLWSVILLLKSVVFDLICIWRNRVTLCGCTYIHPCIAYRVNIGKKIIRRIMRAFHRSTHKRSRAARLWKTVDSDHQRLLSLLRWNDWWLSS